MDKIDALKMIRDGVDALIKLETQENTTAEVKAPATPAPQEKAEAPKVAEKKEDSVDIENMDYRQLKAYAAKLGVKAIGTKSQLIAKIRELEVQTADEPQEEVETQEVKEAPAKDEPKESELMQSVRKAIKEQGLTDDDLRSVLEDIDVSTKGGHEELVSKIADAVAAGDISLDDDEDSEDDGLDGAVEEESDDAEVEEDASEVAEDDEEEEVEETPERKAAVEKFEKETRQQFKDGELSVEDMKEFLKDFGATTPKKMSDKDVLDLYINSASLLIDDDGNTVEDDAYILHGEAYCCGHALDLDENGKATCPFCGKEHEFEIEED